MKVDQSCFHWPNNVIGFVSYQRTTPHSPPTIQNANITHLNHHSHYTQNPIRYKHTPVPPIFGPITIRRIQFQTYTHTRLIHFSVCVWMRFDREEATSDGVWISCGPPTNGISCTRATVWKGYMHRCRAAYSIHLSHRTSAPTIYILRP